MKTTKKGFTLIELIVVIAIIGVLAAILVPTMLGYVRKSKLSSANSTASSVYKAINSALTELDEEGIDVGGDYIMTYNVSTGKWSQVSSDDDKELFGKKVSNFFADINKVKNGVQCAISNGSCVAVAVASDSTYTGTYPAGVITSDNYNDYKGTTQAALKDAIGIAAGVAKASGENVAAGSRYPVSAGDYKAVYDAAGAASGATPAGGDKGVA